MPYHHGQLLKATRTTSNMDQGQHGQHGQHANPTPVARTNRTCKKPGAWSRFQSLWPLRLGPQRSGNEPHPALPRQPRLRRWWWASRVLARTLSMHVLVRTYEDLDLPERTCQSTRQAALARRDTSQRQPPAVRVNTVAPPDSTDTARRDGGPENRSGLSVLCLACHGSHPDAHVAAQPVDKRLYGVMLGTICQPQPSP